MRNKLSPKDDIVLNGNAVISWPMIAFFFSFLVACFVGAMQLGSVQSTVNDNVKRVLQIEDRERVRAEEQKQDALHIAELQSLSMVAGRRFDVIEQQNVEMRDRELAFAKQQAAMENEQIRAAKSAEIARERIIQLEATIKEIISHAAHNPIEAREMDQLSAGIDKQIAALHSQIDDINRQIAASILLQPSPKGLQSPPISTQH